MNVLYWIVMVLNVISPFLYSAVTSISNIEACVAEIDLMPPGSLYLKVYLGARYSIGIE